LGKLLLLAGGEKQVCMMGQRHLIPIVFAIFVIGCGQPTSEMTPQQVLATIGQTKVLELYSLEPYDPLCAEEKSPTHFHGWKILGSTKVESAEVREMLVGALERSVSEAAGGAGCFNPRHGLRVVHGGRVIDLVICFECNWIKIFVDDREQQMFLIGGFAQRSFDAVLTDAQVDLPKSNDE
jgi:hypothetical protein